MAQQDRRPPREQSGRHEQGRRFEADQWYQGRNEDQDDNPQWGRHQPRQGGDFEERYQGRGGGESRGDENSQRGQWRDQSYGGGRYENDDHLRTGGSYGGDYDEQDQGRYYSSSQGRNLDRQYGQGRGRSQYGGQREQGGPYGQSRYGQGGREQERNDSRRDFGPDPGRDYGQRSPNYSSGQNYGSGSSGRYGTDYSMTGAGLQGQWERGFGDMSRGTSGGFGQRGGQPYEGSSYGSTQQGREWSQQNRGEQSSWLGGGTTQGQQRQSFRGRGPKGYERSDERLKELICERLLEDPHIDASEITVEVKSREVTLEGTVDDRRVKYEIEELVERCGGVKDVKNQLRVRARGSESGDNRNIAAQLSTSESNYGTSGRSGVSSGAGTAQSSGTSGSTQGGTSGTQSGRNR